MSLVFLHGAGGGSKYRVLTDVVYQSSMMDRFSLKFKEKFSYSDIKGGSFTVNDSGSSSNFKIVISIEKKIASVVFHYMVIQSGIQDRIGHYESSNTALTDSIYIKGGNHFAGFSESDPVVGALVLER